MLNVNFVRKIHSSVGFLNILSSTQLVHLNELWIGMQHIVLQFNEIYCGQVSKSCKKNCLYDFCQNSLSQFDCIDHSITIIGALSESESVDRLSKKSVHKNTHKEILTFQCNPEAPASETFPSLANSSKMTPISCKFVPVPCYGSDFPILE